MLLRTQGDLTTLVIAFIVMIMALIFHNIVQAFVANRLGDPSPRLAGFMAFDPQRHLDLVGAIFLLILGFGWPRAVPINARNYRGRGRAEAWVWLSGVGAYLIVAFLCLLVGTIFISMQSVSLYVAFFAAAQYALLHAVINIFPLLPLDGGRAALAWGQPDLRRFINQVAQFGVLGFIVFFFILNATGVINWLMRFFSSIFIRLISLIPGL